MNLNRPALDSSLGNPPFEKPSIARVGIKNDWQLIVKMKLQCYRTF